MRFSASGEYFGHTMLDTTVASESIGMARFGDHMYVTNAKRDTVIPNNVSLDISFLRYRLYSLDSNLQILNTFEAPILSPNKFQNSIAFSSSGDILTGPHI